MKRWIAALTALVMLLCWAACGCAELSQAQITQANKYFTDMFNRATAVGGAVLVNQKGERIYSFYFGAGDKKNTRPVDDETVYKIASVTKMISAIGIMKLVDEGKIDLDAKIDIGNKKTIVHPRYRDLPVTLRQCMSHTSGLLGSAPYQSSVPWTKLTKYDEKYFSKYKPGTHYEYANLNGGIMCSVIERVSGQSFNTFMTENVFAPLGINAAYASTLLPDSSTLSNTYDYDDMVYMSANKYLKEDAENYDDTCNPDKHYRYSVGSLFISLSGMEKLGVMLANNGEVDGVRILSADSVFTMRMDQSTLLDSSVTGESPYGLCTLRYEVEGVTWYGHQGRWMGLLTDLFYEPISQTVLVFVMNGTPKGAMGRDVNLRVENAMIEIRPWLNLDK
ncbi:MAG: beta-lactamase family protein [Clostridia bacterium]|nr:beta-lactamase family protein [Clostridia bacterium]